MNSVGFGYNELDRVKSVIFRPCTNVAITHITRVASRDKDGMRRYGHSEYSYASNMYKNKKYIMTMNLAFDSYISIDDTSRDWTDDRSVRIGYIQLPIFMKSLKKVIKWFEDEKYDDLYYYENERLKLNIEFQGLREVVQLGFNKGLIFTPAVIRDYDDTDYEGVEMIINNQKCVGLITIDNLMAMYYIFKDMNLYQMGLEMMNYVRRPEFGEFGSTLNSEAETYNSNHNDRVEESTTSSSFRKDKTNPITRGFFK